MTDITLADITNATTGSDGTAAFDVLMQAVERHILKQFKAGRITGSDYATVYLGSVQAVLQHTMQYVLTQEKAGFEGDAASAQVDVANGQVAKVYAEIALIDQKQVTELAQTTDPTGGLTLAQKNLYEAQIKGFEGKHENELLKIYLDTWAVIYSINDGDLAGTEFGIPSFVLQASPTVTLPPIVDAQAVTSAAVYD